MHLPVRFARRFRPLGLLTALLAGVLLLGVACSDSDNDSVETLANPDVTASELANKFLTLLHEEDTDGLRDFLSDAFIIQRADGSHSEKAAYLENLPTINEFTISDVVAFQTGNTLIARWAISVDEVIDGRQFSTEPAPRLSTFVYTDGDWRLASHANFNVPEEN